MINKKVVSTLAGLLIASSTGAQASVLNNKMYLGINTGLSVPFYKNDIDNESFTGNLGLTFGKGFGVYGLEANLMLLSYQKYTNSKLIDWMFGANFYYNFYQYQNWTLRALGGLYAIQSKVKVYGGADRNLGLSAAPQVGVGARYQLAENIAFTTSLNYLKPIMHDYLTNVVYANVGLNLYF